MIKIRILPGLGNIIFYYFNSIHQSVCIKRKAIYKMKYCFSFLYNNYIHGILILFSIFLISCNKEVNPKDAFYDGEYSTSFSLWQPMAKKGNLEAQNYLGIHYYMGLGTKKDWNKAKFWFEKAAKNGYPDAQYNLGLMYQNGQGVERNLIKAYIWFYAAHKQGHKNATKHVNYFLGDDIIHGNQLDYAHRLAQPYILKK